MYTVPTLHISLLVLVKKIYFEKVFRLYKYVFIISHMYIYLSV